MAGAQRAYHQIERLRQLLFKTFEPLAALMEHISKGRKAEQQANQKSKGDGSSAQVKQIGRNNKAGCGQQQQSTGSPLYVGLVEGTAQARSKLDLQQPAVDPGNRTEQFM